MRLGKLRVRNFRSFGDATIDFADLTQATITGDNGAGKSSLVVDAPLWALFGRAHLDLDAVVGTFGDTATVDLEVVVGSAQLLVTRSRKRGGTSTLTVKRMVDDKWSAVVAGVKEAQEYIDMHIMRGRTYAELIASVYMVQGKHSTFTRASQAEAKDIFVNLLALTRWQDRAEYAKAKKNEAQGKVHILRTQLDYLPEADPTVWSTLPDAAARRDELVGLLEAAEDAAMKASAEAHEAAQRNARYDQALLEVQRHAGRVSDLQQQAHDLKWDLDEADKQVGEESFSELEAKRDNLREQRTRWNQWVTPAKQRQASLDDCVQRRMPAAVGVLNDAEGKLADFDAAEAPTCDRCGQSVVDPDAHTAMRDSLVSAVEKIRLEIRTIEATIESDRKALDELGPEPEYNEGMEAIIERRMNAIVEAERRREKHADVCERLKEAELDLRHAEEVLEAAPLRVDVDDLEDAEFSAKTRVRELRTEQTQVTEAIAHMEAAKAQVEANVEKRKSLASGLAMAELDLLDWTRATTAFGRDGIPAYLMDAVLPSVEETANELLAMMSNGTLSVRLATEKELKSGETRNALEILVSDGLCERAFSTYSGGEAFRINFALRVALAEMVAHRSGLDLSMLVVDEPEGLDASGRTALIQALGVIEPRFDTIVLVSHHEDLREALPQQVVVTKGTTGSTVALHE